MNRWDTTVVAPWAAITGKPTTLAGFGLDAEGDTRWKTLEGIIAPTLLNSWTNSGGSEAVAGYSKSPQGIVIVKGLVVSANAGATIFVLPVGYRPSAVLRFYGGQDIPRILVNPDGTVVAAGVLTAGNNCALNFLFRAEA